MGKKKNHQEFRDKLPQKWEQEMQDVKVEAVPDPVPSFDVKYRKGIVTARFVVKLAYLIAAFGAIQLALIQIVKWIALNHDFVLRMLPW